MSMSGGRISIRVDHALISPYLGISRRPWAYASHIDHPFLTCFRQPSLRLDYQLYRQISEGYQGNLRDVSRPAGLRSTQHAASLPCILMYSSPALRRHAHAADSVSGLPWCLISVRCACPRGRYQFAGGEADRRHGAAGERGTRPRRPDGAGRREASRMAGTATGRPTITGNPGPRERNQPGIIRRAGAPAGGQAFGTPRRSRPGTVQVAEAQEDATAGGRPRSCPGVTLGDEDGQGERAQSRGSGRLPARRSSPRCSTRTGRSARLSMADRAGRRPMSERVRVVGATRGSRRVSFAFAIASEVRTRMWSSSRPAQTIQLRAPSALGVERWT